MTKSNHYEVSEVLLMCCWRMLRICKHVVILSNVDSTTPSTCRETHILQRGKTFMFKVRLSRLLRLYLDTIGLTVLQYYLSIVQVKQVYLGPVNNVQLCTQATILLVLLLSTNVNILNTIHSTAHQQVFYSMTQHVWTP